MDQIVTVYDVPAAKTSILRRSAWDEVKITPGLQAGIERVFGKPLTPDQAVRTILHEVRTRGDAALFEYNMRIEGVEVGALRVSETEMETAWQNTPPELREALSVSADRIRALSNHLSLGLAEHSGSQHKHRKHR